MGVRWWQWQQGEDSGAEIYERDIIIIIVLIHNWPLGGVYYVQLSLYVTMHTACSTYRSFCHWQEQWRHQGQNDGQHCEQLDGHCKEGGRREEGLTIKLKMGILTVDAYFLPNGILLRRVVCLDWLQQYRTTLKAVPCLTEHWMVNLCHFSPLL